MTTPATQDVTLTINGKSVTVKKDTYVIDAAKQVGIHIPYFCSHTKLAPDANCRMCLVEVEKMPKLQASCNLPVADGMVVNSCSDKAEAAHEGVMELILANHPLDCPLCDQGGECELQDRSHDHSDNYSQYTEGKRTPDKRYFGPYIEREMSRCIQCMRCVRYCDEVMDVRAIVAVNRGDRVEISTFMDQELDCEFCGGCVQICPVGAFTSRVSLYDYRPWQLKKTDSVCAYCADGCSIRLESRVTENEIVRVTSDWEQGRNLGDLCAKGYFGYHFVNDPDRLTTPLIREGEKFVDYPWIEALEAAAQQLSEIKRRHGAAAIGGVISARCTNEAAYLFQKFLRLAVGTPHVDSSARDGHMNTVRALQPIIGHGRMTADYEAIASARVLLVIGSDMTETNPIVALRVKAAVKRQGAELVTVGPYEREVGPISNLVNLASRPIKVRAGTERVVIQALVKAVIEQDVVAPAVTAASPQFVSKISRAVANISWSQIEEQTGVSATAIEEVAKLLASSDRVVILFGQGVTRQAGGFDAVLTLADLALLLDLYARDGSGLDPLCEENNETGVVEMGAAAEYLPGLLMAGEPANRQQYREEWKEALPTEQGWSLMEMLDQARQGRLKALYLVGEDPLGSLPDSAKVDEALASLDLLICQDLFFTKTCGRAHIVLPAASFAEKEGSFTNQEGVQQRIQRAIEPVGDALPDWEILTQLSKEFGYPLEYASAGEITDEIHRVIPLYRDRGSAEHRQGSTVDHARLGQYRATGFDVGLDRRYGPLPTRQKQTEKGKSASFTLVIGQSLFHSGKLSRHSKELEKLEPAGRLQLNPADADRMGLEDGDHVALRRVGGTDARDVLVPIVRRNKIPVGVCSFPGHFPECGVHQLVDWSIDAQTQVPYFRSGLVAMEKAVEVSVTSTEDTTIARGA